MVVEIDMDLFDSYQVIQFDLTWESVFDQKKSLTFCIPRVLPTIDTLFILKLFEIENNISIQFENVYNYFTVIRFYWRGHKFQPLREIILNSYNKFKNITRKRVYC